MTGEQRAELLTRRLPLGGRIRAARLGESRLDCAVMRQDLREPVVLARERFDIAPRLGALIVGSSGGNGGGDPVESGHETSS